MWNTLRILALYPFLVHFKDLTFNAYNHIAFLWFFFKFLLFNSWKDFETAAEKEQAFLKQILIWVGESLWHLLFFYVHICATAKKYSN